MAAGACREPSWRLSIARSVPGTPLCAGAITTPARIWCACGGTRATESAADLEAKRTCYRPAGEHNKASWAAVKLIQRSTGSSACQLYPVFEKPGATSCEWVYAAARNLCEKYLPAVAATDRCTSLARCDRHFMVSMSGQTPPSTLVSASMTGPMERSRQLLRRRQATNSIPTSASTTTWCVILRTCVPAA